MERADKFIAELKTFQPGLNLAYKDESWFMKFLGKILFFNPQFMTGFVTTIGDTIYFPSRLEFEKRAQNPKNLLATLAHEYVHVHDRHRFTFLLFSLIYLFPISLIPFLIGLFWVIWWPIVLGIMLLCLAPLPAIGRKYFEMRGYTMTLFVLHRISLDAGDSVQKRKSLFDARIKSINENFTGFSYYLMWPFGVDKQLSKTWSTMESGEFQKTDVIYRNVVLALENSK